jgi:hypothetical protein
LWPSRVTRPFSLIPPPEVVAPGTHDVSKPINRHCRASITHVKSCVLGHNSLQPDPDALNHSQEYRTHDRTVPRSFQTTSYCQRATCKEARDDRVIWILLFPDALDCAVKGAELYPGLASQRLWYIGAYHATPDSKVASRHRCSCFYRRDHAYPSFAVG